MPPSTPRLQPPPTPPLEAPPTPPIEPPSTTPLEPPPGTGPRDLYRYRATILGWHDGDTAEVDVDLGCRVHWHGPLRAAGYNAPELSGATKAAGRAATEAVKVLAPPGLVIYLNSLAFEHGSNTDHFGRLLAAVTLPDGEDLAALMINSGHAVPYRTTK